MHIGLDASAAARLGPSRADSSTMPPALGPELGVDPTTGARFDPRPTRADADADDAGGHGTGAHDAGRSPLEKLLLRRASDVADADDPATSEDVETTGPVNLLAAAQADLLRDPSLRQVEDDPLTPEDESAQGPTSVVDAELTDDEQAQVAELRARDREVRAHEAAHAAAGGALAGSPTYTYQTGPDGRRYAVGGEVKIATGGGDTPEERLADAARVRAAAMAPANPSGQDRAVAAAAAMQAAQARADLQEARAAERRDPVDGDDPAVRPRTAEQAGIGAPAADVRDGPGAFAVAHAERRYHEAAGFAGGEDDGAHLLLVA